jgi:hypothetical protein
MLPDRTLGGVIKLSLFDCIFGMPLLILPPIPPRIFTRGLYGRHILNGF